MHPRCHAIMALQWHVFTAQLISATCALFIVLALCRFTVLEGVASTTPVDGAQDALYRVDVIVTPFLYVDTNARTDGGELIDTGVFDAISEAPEWSASMDLMPTCSQFGRIAVAAECAHETGDCNAVGDQSRYERDCHVARSLWIVGALLFVAAQFAIVWPFWNKDSSGPRALLISSCFLSASAIVFTIYAVVFVKILNGISTIVTTDGISDIDTAEHALIAFNALLYIGAILGVAVAVLSRQQSDSSGGYTLQLTSPLFWP